MRIGIALPTLTDGDAVGHDVLGMARVIRRRGYDVDFFAWNARVKEPVRGLNEIPKLMRSPDDVFIYHHSIGCEPVVKAMEKLPCRRMAVKYHNVTPPKYFAKKNPKIAEGCQEGLDQIPRLARLNAHLWADSAFNAADFTAVAPDKPVAVLPPFHQSDDLFQTDPDYRAVAGLDDWSTNILLVGRLVPNKNVPLAIEAFANYRERFDPRARLLVVGGMPVAEHAGAIYDLVRETGQSGHVVITGAITVAQLKAMYLTADVLLVTSEHEGFCVPLIEAMGLRVPVVAVPNAAVPFTAGDCARFADGTPEAIADTIDAVLTDPEARESQLARGWTRYAENFATAAIEAKFEALLDELLAG